MIGIYRVSVIVAVCFVVFVGCSGDGSRMLEGTVTLDGEPLSAGSVQFFPAYGTDGVATAGKIDQGRFVIPVEKGMGPGKYRVEIWAALRKTGKKVSDFATGQPVDEFEQVIPAKYNRESTLTAEITAAGPNRFEFKLTSR